MYRIFPQIAHFPTWIHSLLFSYLHFSFLCKVFGKHSTLRLWFWMTTVKTVHIRSHPCVPFTILRDNLRFPCLKTLSPAWLFPLHFLAPCSMTCAKLTSAHCLVIRVSSRRRKQLWCLKMNSTTKSLQRAPHPVVSSLQLPSMAYPVIAKWESEVVRTKAAE